MGWLDNNRIVVGGSAPPRLRFEAFLLVGIVLLIVSLMFGLGGYALGISLIGGWLAIAVTERLWQRRDDRAPENLSSQSRRKD